MKKLGLAFGVLVLLLAMGNPTFAQLGGSVGYAFLGIAPTAKAAALGGLLPQNGSEDAAAMLYNPAGHATSGIASVGYNPFGGRFRYSTVAAMADAWQGTAGAAVQFIDYGTFAGFDPAGNATGTFRANAYVATFNYSRALGPFRYGANFKMAGSSIEAYNSFGIGADIGFAYKHPKKNFSAGLCLQNMGATLQRFTPDGDRSWPFQIHAGASYKFEHMPVRFFATTQQLQRWDIVYLDPRYNVVIDPSGQQQPQRKPWTEKLFRHVAIGAELSLGKSVLVRGGYNHLLRKEMKLAEGSAGAAGYSFGVGLKLKKMQLDYTHMLVSSSGGANFINLSYAFGRQPGA